MRDPRTDLPPMNSLAVFETAARRLSFTRAAQELTISREAVSRHIRGLEANLGAPLFRRMHRSLELTSEGRLFYDAARKSLEGVRSAARAVKNTGAPRTVTVLATIAISSFWLTPRLPRLQALEPDVRIRILASDQPPDPDGEQFDIGVIYGDGDWPGFTARKLFPVRSFPVCAPDYLRRTEKIRHPDDLRRCTLLNLEGARHSSEDWVWWLEHFGETARSGLRIIEFDNYSNVVQAALDGQGVALGFSGLIDGLLARGSLVRALETEFNPGHHACLVTPDSRPSGKAAQKLADWIVEDASREFTSGHTQPLQPRRGRQQAVR